MMNTMTAAAGDLLILAAEGGAPAPTDCRVGGADCAPGSANDLADNDAGGYILALVQELSWLRGLIATLGACGALYLVGKFVWSKFKGQGGGAQGGMGQVVAGLAALTIAFNPEFIAGIADVVIRALVNVGSFLFGRVD